MIPMSHSIILCVPLDFLTKVTVAADYLRLAKKALSSAEDDLSCNTHWLGIRMKEDKFPTSATSSLLN